MTFINWSFLEKELAAFKKTAKSEVLTPADMMHLTPPSRPGSEERENESSTDDIGATRDTYIPKTTPVTDESSGEEIQFIEVENIKGNIKKINPDDYIVTIVGSNNDILYSNSLKQIGAGVYLDILKKYGSKQTLYCIVKDFVHRPELVSESNLNFAQAKMILASLKNTLGHIPQKSAEEVLTKLNTTNQNNIKEWLKQQKM